MTDINDSEKIELPDSLKIDPCDNDITHTIHMGWETYSKLTEQSDYFKHQAELWRDKYNDIFNRYVYPIHKSWWSYIDNRFFPPADHPYNGDFIKNIDFNDRNVHIETTYDNDLVRGEKRVIIVIDAPYEDVTHGRYPWGKGEENND